MAFMLAAYGSDAFQEFFLPQTNDADHSLVLSQSVFGLKEDITVSFEVIGGTWRFVGLSNNARLRGPRSNSLNFGEVLEPGRIIHIRQDEATIGLVVMAPERNLGCFTKYLITRPCTLEIGSAEGCNIVYDFQGLVSRTHATLEVSPKACRIIDRSRNGIYLGGRRVRGELRLSFGEVVSIFGLQIVWMGSVLAIGTLGQSIRVWAPEISELKDCGEIYPDGYREVNLRTKRKFHRSPRAVPALHSEQIEIETVPQSSRSSHRPLILTIGPSLTMVIPMSLGCLMAIVASSSSGGAVSPYMYTGLVIAGASALLGVMWALINLRYSKKTEREAELNRTARYQQYLQEVESDISQKAEENRQTLEMAYPSGSVCAGYDALCTNLWNRNMSHADVLFVRLGIGNVPFQCEIKIPKRGFSLYDDQLAELPSQIRDRYQILHNVPVGVDLLEHRLYGVVGDGGISASDIMRCIAVQLAANNCYTDVKMVFIAEERTLESGGAWGFARWLPHVWSENKTTRFCASTQSEINEVCFELAEIIRSRTERDEEDAEPIAAIPHYVVFVEDIELLSNDGILKSLLAADETIGFTTLIMASHRELLPNACENIIESTANNGYINDLSAGEAERRNVAFDSVSIQTAESFARRISSVEVSEVESSGAIPESLTFFDMWGVKRLEELNVLDRWRKNRTYNTMRALIGQKAGGRDWYLDIHEKHHGPHGLIAGTTGSGKSETLQTFMLSLALSFSPDDLAFFVIDYKGGGMANLFSNLPHMAGQISNLSGNQVHRAMVSIKSENRRRQRLFNECGVNHIDSYTRLYKNGETAIPLPHLVIVIDEFAELKKEESSFMRELISVAQVGRSLGVHLILATQRPNGTVDDNIRCNAKFRVCLRVQDRQDSNEMLHRPDAAYITHAGRAFMQVGNDELYEEFQSGWSGADYDETLLEGGTNLASMRTLTGKPAIVGNYLKKQRKDQLRLQWLQQLANILLNAAWKQGKHLPEMMESRMLQSALLQEAYERLAEAKIDYPENRANTARLLEYAAALAQFDEGQLLREESFQTILQEIQASETKLPELKTKTQLAAVVDYLAQIAAENGYKNSFRLWLPVLPEQLYLDQLQGYAEHRFDGTQWFDDPKHWEIEAMVGLIDNPANQLQMPLTLSLSENGNLAICGAAGSGKSTFLQTLLFSLAEHYSPACLNFYVLDFSNRSLASFEELPHCGGVVFEDQTEKLAKFFNMMNQLIAERKKILCGGSYSQYVQRNGMKLPALIVAIDNYASFREKSNNTYEQELLTVSREGNNYGIFMVITSGGFGTNEIPNRIADNLRNVICLELGDKFKYSDVLRTIHFDTLPEAGVKGRGIVPVQGSILEYQTALSIRAADDYGRAAEMQRYFAQMRAAWKGRIARRIPEIPENPKLSDLMEREDYTTMTEDVRYLPFAYLLEDASLYAADLQSTYCWVITGKPRTGKTNLLQLMLEVASTKKAELSVIGAGNVALRQQAERLGARYVENEDKLLEFTRDLQKTFLERNRKKRELIERGNDEVSIFNEMAQLPPIFVFVDDMASFLQIVYRQQDAPGSMRSFYENVIDKGSLHNIYFIVCVDTDNLVALAGRRVYERMMSYKTGVHLGGAAMGQKTFDFSSMPFQEQNKRLKLGIGLLPPDLENGVVRKIVIPQFKG